MKYWDYASKYFSFKYPYWCYYSFPFIYVTKEFITASKLCDGSVYVYLWTNTSFRQGK